LKDLLANQILSFSAIATEQHRSAGRSTLGAIENMQRVVSPNRPKTRPKNISMPVIRDDQVGVTIGKPGVEDSGRPHMPDVVISSLTSGERCVASVAQAGRESGVSWIEHPRMVLTKNIISLEDVLAARRAPIDWTGSGSLRGRRRIAALGRGGGRQKQH
jgi:hypothetical protein